MSSANGSYTREYVPPFSASFAQRISRIHENRENAEKKKENDVLHARANIGSTFRVPSADRSRNYNMERSFGPVRPLSAGRSRSVSGDSRSNSAERSRLSTSQSTTNSEVLRTMTSFDRELQFQRDVAAHEKQKVALLQVKKEAYINYLKNKGNTPWIPGGAGPKHETSTHKSINRNATEYRMQYKAWCRSPWPGLVAGRVEDGESGSVASTATIGSMSQDGFTPYTPVEMGTPISPSRSTRQIVADQFPSGREGLVPPPRLGGVSPQRARPALSAALLPATAGSVERDPLRSSSDSVGTPSSWNRTRGTPTALKHGTSVTTVRKSGASSGAVSGSNSKYVALTVRIIDTAHPAQKSSYGVFIVPRNCTRLEMIANIERQFSVHGQVSDVSITYRSGYSHGVTVSSLSMGTMADVPQVDDYSSITIYLNGATTFDSQGNVHTHPDTAAAVAAQHQQEQGLAAGEAGAVSIPSVLPGRRPIAQGLDMGPAADQAESPGVGSWDGRGFPLQRAPFTSGMGLTAGDNLLVFEEAEGQDGTETVDSFEEETVVPYDGSSLAGSVRSKPVRAATSTTAATATATAVSQYLALQPPVLPQQRKVQPQQAPTYEARHPGQPMHGFSFASPVQPLLGGMSPEQEERQQGELQDNAERVPQGSFRRTASAKFDGLSLLGAGTTAGDSERAMAPRTNSTRSLMQRTGSVRCLAPRTSSARSMLPRTGSTRAMVVPATVRGETAVREEVERGLPAVAAPQRQRRDWLGEAEERLREEAAAEGEALAGQGHEQNAEELVSGAVHEPRVPRQDSFPHGGVTSPAYRSGTASSLSRRRSKAVVGAWDSASVDAGRSLSAGRGPRSHSADHSHACIGNNSAGTGTTRSRALSPQLSLRSTASSRGRSAFINSRAAELEEVNLRLYGEAQPASPRRRSNSVGRDSRSSSSSWSAHPRHPFSAAAPRRAELDQWNGSRFSDANDQVTARRHLGMEGMNMSMYLQGKVFSRSSEELYEDEVGVVQVGLPAERSSTPLFGSGPSGATAYTTTTEGVRAPTVYSYAPQRRTDYSGPYGDLEGEGRHWEDTVSAVRDTLAGPVAAGGGGHHSSANDRGADRTTRRQLSRSLEQLLEEAS